MSAWIYRIQSKIKSMARVVTDQNDFSVRGFRISPTFFFSCVALAASGLSMLVTLSVAVQQQQSSLSLAPLPYYFNPAYSCFPLFARTCWLLATKGLCAMMFSFPSLCDDPCCCCTLRVRRCDRRRAAAAGRNRTPCSGSSRDRAPPPHVGHDKSTQGRTAEARASAAERRHSRQVGWDFFFFFF